VLLLYCPSQAKRAVSRCDQTGARLMSDGVAKDSPYAGSLFASLLLSLLVSLFVSLLVLGSAVALSVADSVFSAGLVLEPFDESLLALLSVMYHPLPLKWMAGRPTRRSTC